MQYAIINFFLVYSKIFIALIVNYILSFQSISSSTSQTSSSLPPVPSSTSFTRFIKLFWIIYILNNFTPYHQHLLINRSPIGSPCSANNPTVICQKVVIMVMSLVMVMVNLTIMLSSPLHNFNVRPANKCLKKYHDHDDNWEQDSTSGRPHH